MAAHTGHPGTALLLFLLIQLARAADQPHIIMIVADDLGFNDIGIHGANQIPTPNINAMAFAGNIIHRHYCQPLCTPTRAALLTGRYPIRFGLQGSPFNPGERRALPEGKLLPEYLRDLGYATHAIGKWHLGYSREEYTPMFRGFDSHVGYYSGLMSYYDHSIGLDSASDLPRGLYGFDLHVNMSTDTTLRGRYATDIFSERAEEVIAAHDARRPLFLYFAHLAVHAGNDAQLLEAPWDAIQNMSHVRDPNRRLLAATVSKMDESVGRVFKSLQSKNMLNNSIVLFLSDNGAPTHGLFRNWGSNYPLRGIKDTFWEGGVRTAAAIWSPLLIRSSAVLEDYVHVTDWLPTLVAAAGGDPAKIPQALDGINQWDWLAGSASAPRRELLVNIDERVNSSAYISGNYKFVQGLRNQQWNDYYGDSGTQGDAPALPAAAIWSSPAGAAIASVVGADILPSQDDIDDLLEQATVVCNGTQSNCIINGPNDTCLFDIINDPCELNNVSAQHQDIVKEIQARIQDYQKELVDQLLSDFDLSGSDPELWNRTWTTWETCQNATRDWCQATPTAVASAIIE